MKKVAAIKLLGPSVHEAAGRVGCSDAAIRKWPEDLPPRLVDRVIAAAVRAVFERLPTSGQTGRITLPAELFGHLWHEALLMRAEKNRKADAEALARKIAAYDEAKKAAKRQPQERTSS